MMRLWTVIAMTVLAGWMLALSPEASRAWTVSLPGPAAETPAGGSPAASGFPAARSIHKSPTRKIVPRGRWKLDLSRGERLAFLRSVASLRPVPKAMLERLQARTVVRSLDHSSCGGHSACAVGTFTQLGTTRTATYELEFIHGILDTTTRSRFLVAHELAHLIEYEGLSATGRRAFELAFRSSPAWRDCFPYRNGCVPPPEVFADQFAMYALGAPASRTGYGVPRLVSDATFERLLRLHYRPSS